MATTDIIMWCSIEFAMAGYILTQIEKSKKTDADIATNTAITDSVITNNQVDNVIDDTKKFCPECNQEIIP